MNFSCIPKGTVAARGTVLAIALVQFATSSPAQPGTGACVPGTNPLQAAVDAAQPGDAIDVGLYPNLGQGICVTKPLLFFSTTTTPATVTGAPGFGFCDTPWGAFHIVPGVSGVVAFQNLQVVGVNVGGGVTLPCLDGVMRGIYSQSANATVVLDGCTVRGADFTGLGSGDSLAHGAAGIEGAVARLVLMDSQVFGGDADDAAWSNPWSPTIFCYLDSAVAGGGGDAIDVTGEALLVRSTLSGGIGGDAVGDSGPPCFCAPLPPPPSHAVAGTGGSAVVAPIIWSWGSTGTGGAGGVVRCGPAIYGFAPSGASLPPGLGAALQVGPQPTLGGSATLTVLSSQPAAMGVGTNGFGPGVQVPGGGPYFLGPFPIVFPAVTAPAVNSIPIPVDPALVGQAFPVQATVPFGVGFLTNPDVVLILP